MNNFNTHLKNYAKLTVKIGLNVQKNQPVVITSPVEVAYFTRLVVNEAYNAGACDVFVRWIDDAVTRARYEFASETALSTFKDWQRDMMVGFAEDGACFLSISATDPDLLNGIPSERIDMAQKTMLKGLAPFRKYTMNDINSWCVISVPTAKWAKKVFPNSQNADEAINMLWEKIFEATRTLENDPVRAWKDHLNLISEKSAWLNKMQFEKLHYTSSNGTDLWVELPKKHIWAGGTGNTTSGIPFVANMPTEEVFTLPKKDGVNGIVYSTKPLNYSGNLIEDFMVEFKNGKAINVSARSGENVLKDLISTDEGSAMLGEVALVPYESPISNTKVLFFNTLFDENASCHFAFGKAYPTCIEGGTQMNEEELHKHGVNDSLIHVDFMVGAQDTNIVGITSDGKEYDIFKNGNWA